MGKLPKGSLGMTLIELVIAIALLTVIILAGTTFYLYGAGSFAEGGNRARLQSDVRMTADFLAESIRNTTNLTILPANAAFPDGYSVGLTIRSGEFIAIKEDGFNRAPAAPLVQDIVVSFKNESGKVLMHYYIKGSYKNESYDLSEDIVLNNISASFMQQKIDFGKSYSLKEYTTYIMGDI